MATLPKKAKDQTIHIDRVRDSRSASDSSARRILTEAECEATLARNFSEKKEWVILICVALVQISMNLNASIYGNAVLGLQRDYEGVTKRLALGGASIFLLAYAFGCELWAPWSEESGRWKVMQWSLALVNLWQIPQIIAVFVLGRDSGTTLMGVIMFFRFMGGLCSAGGSVTLGMVADMFGAHLQDRPMAWTVLWSVMGSVIGPIIGGFIESFAGWRWVFVTQFAIGFAVQMVHLFFVPETRSSAIVTKEAKRLRKSGRNVESEAESAKVKFMSKAGLKHAGNTWARPFKMFVKEPIVLFLSLISGFSDALIFTFLESMGMVMRQWGFRPWQTGLCFCSIGLGYFFGYAIWMADILRRRSKDAKGTTLTPESRLTWLLWTAPMLCLSMFAYAWLATGPPLHWIWANIALVFTGIANYAIYGSTVDYMVAAYGEKYSASATGGNGFARDFLAGISSFYAASLYSGIGPPNLQLPLGSTVLAAIAVPLIIPIYLFYIKGSKIRMNSKYARVVEEERQEKASGAQRGTELT